MRTRQSFKFIPSISFTYRNTDGRQFTEICKTLKENPTELISSDVLLKIQSKEDERVKKMFKLDNSKFISTW